MGVWLLSRLFSYCIIAEFIDYLAQFSALRVIVHRSFIMPSEFVDIVDSSVPLDILIFREILLLGVIFGLFVLGYKLIKKGEYRFCDAVIGYGKVVFWMGVVGIASRAITFLSLLCFLDWEYEALGVTCARDGIYLLLGALVSFTGRKIPGTETAGSEHRILTLKRVLRILFGILFGAILLISVLLNIGLTIYYFNAVDIIYEQEYELLNAQNEIEALEQAVKDLDKQVVKYKSKYFGEKNEKEKVLTFFRKHIAFIVDNGSRVYHTYDCRIFQNADSYWAYNVAAAEGDGYSPCAECH